ncbi:MAG: hypothetical protein P8O03_14490 [Ilumatobacter sp.]|nr:hypothetical protein [Ilumatobacter sp.]MDG2038995.1 hypothetical protein [Ilumatobacter sp.]
MSTTEPMTSTVQRPGVVTFIAAILYIQAAIAVTATVTMLIWRGPILNSLEQEGSPLSSGAFTGTIIAEAFSAILLVMVASGLMRGSNGIRLFAAVVQGLSMALAMYVLVAHHVGGYMYRAVFSLFVGVFVLWALYGNDESDEFFDSDWP